MSDFIYRKEFLAKPEFNFTNPEKKQQIIDDYNKGIKRRFLGIPDPEKLKTINEKLKKFEKMEVEDPQDCHEILAPNTPVRSENGLNDEVEEI